MVNVRHIPVREPKNYYKHILREHKGRLIYRPSREILDFYPNYDRILTHFNVLKDSRRLVYSNKRHDVPFLKMKVKCLLNSEFL